MLPASRQLGDATEAAPDVRDSYTTLAVTSRRYMLRRYSPPTSNSAFVI